MTVVTDISLSSSAFEIGRTFESVPIVSVTFDRTIPLNSGTVPYMRIYTTDHELVQEQLERAPLVEELTLVQLQDDEGLYRSELNLEDDELIQCLKRSGVAILHATGEQKRWEFELRFDTHDDVRAFQRACRDRDLSISFDRVVSGSTGETAENLLSPRQQETIELALERGFFEVPRQTSMVELAEEFGISDQAVSARLRRGVKKLCQRRIVEPDQKNLVHPK